MTSLKLMTTKSYFAAIAILLNGYLNPVFASLPDDIFILDSTDPQSKT